MCDVRPMRLLIVDCEQATRDLCEAIGRGMGLDCLQAASAEEALECISNCHPEVLLAALSTGSRTGAELVTEAKMRLPLIECVLMGPGGTAASGAQEMRRGGYCFVAKPLQVDELKLALERIVEKVLLVRENEALRCRLQEAEQAASVCCDLEELERRTMQRVFGQVGGNKEQAQRLLGISRATLYRKIKRYGIGKEPEGLKDGGQETREVVDRMILLSQS